jgi:putative transposase
MRHIVGKRYLYREVLDHAIILNERHLWHILQSYLRYYSRWRTHLSLMTDCPHAHLTQQLGRGKLMAVPEVGGLHHHYGYERAAAS